MSASPIRKVRPPVLIANRGEIAIRIARTCRALGFPTVAIYSEADRFAEHVRVCDQAYFVGGSAPKDSYLHVERVIAAAKASGACYVHPGYGFLSERAHFVEACEKAGITFVGPSAECMRTMGDKVKARETVAKVGVPGIPGSLGVVKDLGEMKKIAQSIGYPVLLKAAAGGGGKGMRRVDQEADLASSYEAASREALGAFGDGSMYLEKFILNPHHVEIQVFGDGKGRAIHLGERECSIQRRHQKVWEESPAPILERYPETRKKMFEAAVKVTEYVNYAGAGTLEFIVDGSGNFYFLEMNTRLQVEHPVTEWVTGVDLVAWQLWLAESQRGQGNWLVPKEAPARTGWSLEVRLYAEDPMSFLPAPGPLSLIHLPSGSFVRTDSAFSGPGEVSVHYDPMIAKISVWRPDRELALERMQSALDEVRVQPPKRLDGTRVGSLRTNLSFLRRLVRNEQVRNGDTTTDLIYKNPELTQVLQPEPSLEAAVAASLFQLLQENAGMNSVQDETSPASSSLWALTARREGL